MWTPDLQNTRHAIFVDPKPLQQSWKHKLLYQPFTGGPNPYLPAKQCPKVHEDMVYVEVWSKRTLQNPDLNLTEQEHRLHLRPPPLTSVSDLINAKQTQIPQTHSNI